MSLKIYLYLLNLRQNRRVAQSGFTLIELLVVIVIIGILGAIALPSYLSQANKARQTEAKTYVGAINRAQQVYHMQYLTFGTLNDLELSIAASTQLYSYVSTPEASGVAAQTTATPNFYSTSAYSGRVWLVTTSGNTTSLLCEGQSGVPPVISGTSCP